MAEKKYHTVRETMDRLAIGKTTVYQLAKSGMLEMVRLPSPKKPMKPSTKKPATNASRPTSRPGVEPRQGLTRIKTDSIERYERGEARPNEEAPARPAAVTLRQVRTRMPGKTVPMAQMV